MAGAAGDIDDPPAGSLRQLDPAITAARPAARTCLKDRRSAVILKTRFCACEVGHTSRPAHAGPTGLSGVADLADHVPHRQEHAQGQDQDHCADADDQDRLQLRELLLAGAASAPAAPVDGAYFEGLRNRVRKVTKAGAKR